MSSGDQRFIGKKAKGGAATDLHRSTNPRRKQGEASCYDLSIRGLMDFTVWGREQEGGGSVYPAREAETELEKLSNQTKNLLVDRLGLAPVSTTGINNKITANRVKEKERKGKISRAAHAKRGSSFIGGHVSQTRKERCVERVRQRWSRAPSRWHEEIRQMKEEGCVVVDCHWERRGRRQN